MSAPHGATRRAAFLTVDTLLWPGCLARTAVVIMPFDTIAMAAVADELATTLEGGRIQRILQPSATSIALAIYVNGTQHWLVLSADPRFARVNLSSDRLAKAFTTPSSFVMLLRKHLDGARVTDVRHIHGERVLNIRCLGGETDVELVAEVMGKHSNVMLVAGGTILGALKIVPPGQSRVRPVRPGILFSLPPVQARDEKLFPPGPRIDPFADPVAFEQTIRSLPPDTLARRALLGLLAGASPFLADQVLFMAGGRLDSTVSTLDSSLLTQAASDLYGLYTSRCWEPCIFTNAKGQRDFAPYVPFDVSDVEPAASMSVAIERCLGTNESRDSLLSARAAVLGEIDRLRRSAARRLASLQEGLAAAEGAEAVMERGQLILAYQYLIPPKAAEVEIPDLDLTIPLDPALDAVSNAERTFKRYHKLRDAGRRVPSLLADTERELTRLDDLAAFARLATTDAELRALARSVTPAVGEAKPRKDRNPSRGPGRFSTQGHTVIVGRNALENEEVTFRLAGRDDLWLHARERTGAHVILQGGDRGAPDEMIRAAAELAAYYSEGRTDSAVDVDVARPRDVRKIPGGAPGRVTYRNFKTVRVRPTLGAWEAISSKR